MNNYAKRIVAIVSLLFAGGACGWLANVCLLRCERDSCGPVAENSQSGVKPKETPRPADVVKNVRRLRERARQLEREIDEVKSRGVSKAVQKNDYVKGSGTMGESKAKDPDAYASYVKLKEKMGKFKKDREAFLKRISELDLSQLSEDERKNHEWFMGYHDKAMAIVEGWRSWSDETSVEDFEKVGLAWGDFRNDNKMYELKREAAILVSRGVAARAREMGYSEDDAAALGESYRAIFEASNLWL